MSRLTGLPDTRAKYERVSSQTGDVQWPDSQIKRKPVPSSISTPGSSHSKTSDYSWAQSDANASSNDILLDNLVSTSHPNVPYKEHDNNASDQRDWVPITLRWFYLVGLITFTVALIVLVLCLDQYSSKNHGLADSSDAPTLIFSWRFAPTLFAVLYSLFLTIWLGDISRLEPYIRLTNPTGAKSDFTILQVLEGWWAILSYGRSKSKNGGARNYILVCSLSPVVIATLIVSPLSSTLLAPENITIPQNVSFNSFPMLRGETLPLVNQSLTRFHTLSHLLQNANTSAWITDEFAVLPFWPSLMDSAPLNARFDASDGIWRAQTLVLSTELECTPLHLQSKAVTPEKINQNRTIKPAYDYLLSFVLANNDKCAHGVAFDYRVGNVDGDGSIVWFRFGQPLYEYRPYSDSLAWSVNHSSECTGSEGILLTSPLGSRNTSRDPGAEWVWSPDIQINGLDCTTRYYSANVSVNVTVKDEAALTIVDFDKDEFYRHRRVIDDSLIDLHKFEDMFQDVEWSLHLTSEPYDMLITDGAATVLRALYNFSPAGAVKDSNLTSKAQRIKQRYLGEVLISSLQATEKSYTKTKGVISIDRTRILVMHPTAIALSVALSLNLLLLSLVWFMRRKSRENRLYSDPAQVLTIARLLVDGTCSRHELKVLEAASISEREQILRGRECKIQADRLVIGNGIEVRQTLLAEATEDPKTGLAHAWRSFVLKKWTIASFGLVLALFLTLIIILYHFSRHSGLYQNAFIFQIDIRVSDHSSTIAPYSFIPTLLAVGVGLWWGSLETDLKSLQPFLSMTKSPAIFPKGVKLSYRSSYSIWAAIKAGWLRHWLLCLVCTGAVLSQVFTISMSALWQLEEGNLASQITMHRTLELRTIPLWQELNEIVSQRNGQDPSTTMLKGLYGDLTINWLYGANIEMTLNGSGPPWSREDWSFVPIKLESLETGHEQNTSTGYSNTSNSSASRAVKVRTPAVRARLECSPYEVLSNTSLWSTPVNLANSTEWNVTHNPVIDEPAYCLGDSCGAASLCLVPNATSRYGCNLDTSYYAYEAVLKCCEDASNGRGGDAAIGYWSMNSYLEESPDSERLARDNDFTVKWIYGNPIEGIQGKSQNRTIWRGRPELMAINCKPIIEYADADVQVDLSSGRIRSYEILGHPTVDERPWRDDERMYTQIQDRWDYYKHMTMSYGPLFLYTLTHAVDQHFYTLASGRIGAAQEQSDFLFKFRRPGINMDTMSYSMFSQVNQSKRALLDPDILAKHASKTFATYFKHFVNFNLSTEHGGLIYQKINDTLPTAIKSETLSPSFSPLPDSYFVPTSNTNETVEAQLLTPVKMLRMSPVAVWLCIIILVWLLTTMAILFIVEKRYLGKIIRSTKNLADVGILVAGSDALLTHIASGKPDSRDGIPLRTKLGWFHDKDGLVRWGIELYGPGCGVEWLEEEETADGNIVPKGD